ncbi:RING finger domain-containing protein [Colletotrichum tofieldiae]|uniref:RING finger domain-containing protein n=1 Tax=Colletotrichum tofieldiae TaxID=708197 RepID=A0A166YE24_9PEZI|nr:RING finger domain-containing protein [Colletotrichum tofieldiae]GKT57110.1 RING finger domain-containing protein [Colletotrichum tofieldiae]GKT78840.1 RING finger domain-containing protein [Colletotrichum tofieldiae]
MESAKPQWSWPSDVPDGPDHSQAAEAETSQFSQHETQNQDETKNQQQQPQPEASSKKRSYGPRTCRICFEVVHPTFEDPTVVSGFMSRPPRPIYKSEDPESGRLISPCKCKGSQRYVHEGCLQAWRYADSTATRNFFACPTCGYQYKLERLSWANRLQGTLAQVSLTILIFIASVFILGFVADPILNIWSDPIGAIADMAANVLEDIEAIQEPAPEMLEEPGTWLEHFLKGFLSLGLLGFLKTILLMTPWQWWQLRSSGFLGTTGRRGGTGRARVENMNMALVLLGAATFMWGVWKGVRKFSASALQRASDRVFDVGGGDDEDEDEDIKKD